MVLHRRFWSKESIWSLLAQTARLDVTHVFSFLLGKRSGCSPYGEDKYRWSRYTTILNAATNNDTFLHAWYTHVRALCRARRDRDHLWRYRRSRFKKADGPPSYTSFLSKHARCRNRQRSRILRSCPLGVTFQKPQNTRRCPLPLRIRSGLFSLFGFSVLDLFFFKRTDYFFSRLLAILQ